MAPDKENFRGVHAVRLLEKAGDMTIESMIDLAYDPVLPAFEVLLPSLLEAYENSNRDPALESRILTFRNWDYKTQAASVPMSLAHFYGMEILQNAKRPRKGMSRMELFVHMATDASDAEQLALFSAAVKKLEDDYGNSNIAWSVINRYQRLTGDIVQPHDDTKPSVPVGMASGRWGALAAYGARQSNATFHRPS